MNYNINYDDYCMSFSGTSIYGWPGNDTICENSSVNETDTKEITDVITEVAEKPKRKVGRPRKNRLSVKKPVSEQRIGPNRPINQIESETDKESFENFQSSPYKSHMQFDVFEIDENCDFENDSLSVIDRKHDSTITRIENLKDIVTDISDIKKVINTKKRNVYKPVQTVKKEDLVTFNDEDIEEDVLLDNSQDDNIETVLPEIIPNYQGSHNDEAYLKEKKYENHNALQIAQEQEQTNFDIFKDPGKFQNSINLSSAGILECIDAYAIYKSKCIDMSAYETVKKHLKYIQDKYNLRLMPVVMGDIFWRQFHFYLKNERKLMPNTINGLCSRICSVLKWSANYGARLSPTFENYHYKEKWEKPIISLTLDDVSRITYFDIDNLKISTKKKNVLKRCRDMFVLSCYLGQRYSDMIRITPDNFKNNKFVMVQKKTGTKCVNDIQMMSAFPQVVDNILKRYNYTAPYVVSNSVYNRHLHELFKLAGYTDDIIHEWKDNGVIKRKVYKMYELITTHTGRRTMITNAVIRGIRTDLIRRASGHTSEKAFNKYIVYKDD